jgi:hypothetical protein
MKGEQEMENASIQQTGESLESTGNPLVEIPLTDHTGDDLGTFWLDPSQTVSELVELAVTETELPRTNPNGTPRRYEAYRNGVKLPASSILRDLDVNPQVPIEIQRSVMTGLAA